MQTRHLPGHLCYGWSNFIHTCLPASPTNWSCEYKLGIFSSTIYCLCNINIKISSPLSISFFIFKVGILIWWFLYIKVLLWYLGNSKYSIDDRDIMGVAHSPYCSLFSSSVPHTQSFETYFYNNSFEYHLPFDICLSYISRSSNCHVL